MSPLNEKRRPNLRWKRDPYLQLHAEMLHSRGMLAGPDLNEVQLALLFIKKYRDVESENKKREMEFEEKLLIASPERYNSYLEHKKSLEQVDDLKDMEVDEVDWEVPQDLMEFERLEREFRSLLQQHEQNVDREIEDDEDDWTSWNLEEMQD